VQLQLRPTTPLILFEHGQKTNQTDQRGKSQASRQNLEKERYNGNFSEGSRKKALRVAGHLTQRYAVRLQNYRQSPSGYRPVLAFITLTTPTNGGFSHQAFKRECLNLFFIKFRRRYPRGEYIWRAELQKNGNIHFHILTDIYVDKEWLRRIWAQILRRRGLLERPDNKWEHKDPPCTEVERCRTVQGSLNYTTKYLTKDDNQTGAKGRQWGSSLEYDKIKYMGVRCGRYEFEMVRQWIEEKAFDYVDFDYGYVVRVPTLDFITRFCPDYLSDYNAFLFPK
jgi:hypothetical protein